MLTPPPCCGSDSDPRRKGFSRSWPKGSSGASSISAPYAPSRLGHCLLPGQRRAQRDWGCSLLVRRQMLTVVLGDWVSWRSETLVFPNRASLASWPGVAAKRGTRATPALPGSLRTATPQLPSCCLFFRPKRLALGKSAWCREKPRTPVLCGLHSPGSSWENTASRGAPSSCLFLWIWPGLPVPWVE